jgi:hypothetical protein
MKKILLSIFMLAAFLSEAQDTLKNFDPQAQAPAVLQYTGTANGYYTGHNSYFDEEWAEKYYIPGTNQVVGVIAYHTGTAGTYTENCRYKVYNVAATGLPGTSLGEKAVAGSNINISGTPVYTAFNSAINVADSFFVSFDLGDYAHDDPGTKKIALMHGPAGSRAAADTLKFGRNVIRWHNHDHTTMDWKDFYFENSTPVPTHFAIFPVVAFQTANVAQYAGSGKLKMGAAYPNPALGDAHVEMVATRAQAANCKLMDVTGKLLHSRSIALNNGATIIDVPMSALPSGAYILAIEAEGTTLCQLISKH